MDGLAALIKAQWEYLHEEWQVIGCAFADGHVTRDELRDSMRVRAIMTRGNIELLEEVRGAT